MKKNLALAIYLGEEENVITQSTYDENVFECGAEEYLVLTDEEADKKAKEYILDSLWAFNADFILNHSVDEWNDRTEKSLRRTQEELCEDANPLIKAMIEDLDEFVEDAIDADGRGHFLSSYDGEENESEGYYIYRTN